jgi:hypothetical protein
MGLAARSAKGLTSLPRGLHRDPGSGKLLQPNTRRFGSSKTMTKQTQALIRSLYRTVGTLEKRYDRRFTLDGHLIGSIGEVIARDEYGLELLTASARGHDAITADGRRVEIKATQGRTVALRSEPKHLLVLHLTKDGGHSVVYNGPGKIVWKKCGPEHNGQRTVSLSVLRYLQKRVGAHARLKPAPH